MKRNQTKIREILPKGWEEAAKETGAFTRSRKIKTPEELLMLNLLYLTNGGSFGKTAAMLKLTAENSLNKNAVYERIRKSTDWLQWLCSHICREEGYLAEPPEWLENRRICLVDASDESKPGSKGADYRLHYLVELFQLRMVEMHMTEAKEGEKISRFKEIRKGDVIVGDRAYGTLKGISYVKEQEGDYLFRLRGKAFKLYLESGEEVNLPEALGYLKEGESTSLSLFYKEGKKLKPIRICATRKSKEAQEKGIRQIKKSNSKKMRGKVSELQEAYNAYIIVCTSLPEEIEAEKIMELYRMRWQIELVFKRFKSIFDYDEIPSKNEKTAYGWFYGKLLVAAICETLVNKGRFSPAEK